MTRAQTPRHAPRYEHAHAPTTEPHATANPVRIVVDLNRCQGYAQCCFLAPSVFMLHGEEALWYDPAPDAALREQVRQAAAACPVQAITVERPAGPGRQHRKHAEHKEQGEAPHAAQRS